MYIDTFSRLEEGGYRTGNLPKLDEKQPKYRLKAYPGE